MRSNYISLSGNWSCSQGFQNAYISQDSVHLGCLCVNYLDHQFLESLGSVDQVPLNWDFNCSANPLQVPNLIKGTLLLRIHFIASILNYRFLESKLLVRIHFINSILNHKVRREILFWYFRSSDFRETFTRSSLALNMSRKLLSDP